MGVHLTYHDNHFMMHVSHGIMLYTLNLGSAVCQYKSEGKKYK